MKWSFARSAICRRLEWVLNAFRLCGCLGLAIALFSCSSGPPIASEKAPDGENLTASNYVVVFIIHGDGSYLAHDTDGNAFRADDEVLAGAIKVAVRNAQAEVFIFHEKRRKHFLLFFPRRDGEFYYYRNGRLLAQESYWRDHGRTRFAPEIALYNAFRGAVGAQPKRLFLYFGHEIPEVNGTGYDASYRDRSFTVDDLADGLAQMMPDSAKMDLVVLSTCFNGTPRTIAALSPLARYIVASPGSLHLSYFDLRPFETLDSSLHENDMSKFALESARQSFDRLAQEIQTEITVAVYDVNRVQEYLESIDSVYVHALSKQTTATPTSIAHCDCAEGSAYVRPAMSEGINLFYRPARFGRSANKLTHSGWGCPKPQF